MSKNGTYKLQALPQEEFDFLWELRQLSDRQRIRVLIEFARWLSGELRIMRYYPREDFNYD